ncbi:hypothetical protein RUM44_006827 [Polyplax serrata]|uniref:Cytidyltransferase-like domain-containing protein n=1 Tax=Polyplax serrata TaxID=468196 RepID=A0ABR1AJ78_POLSC
MSTGFLVAKLPGKLMSFSEVINQHFLKKLYIYVAANNQPNLVNNEWVSKRITDLYASSTSLFPNLDVRIILNELKRPDKTTIEISDLNIDVIIFPQNYNTEKITSVADLNKKLWVMYNEVELTEDANSLKYSNMKTYQNVVLGGTFDKLHNGHKILLTEALLRCKKLSDLIEPPEKRINEVEEFIKSVDPTLTCEVLLISDLYGPTKSDPNLNMIVVSSETYKGALKINELRKEMKLNELDIHVVELAQDCSNNEIEESKVSSSNNRIRLLGTYLKTPVPKPHLPSKPYMIGLTGGVASGKSSICKYIGTLGAGVIDCDKVAHELYKPETKIYYKLIEVFGGNIVSENGEINRKILGSIVFNDSLKLQKLNELLWPEIIKKAVQECERLYEEENKKIVVLEAAVLLKANWQDRVHEVWSTIIPQDEAIARLMKRNNLSEEDARLRVNAQSSNLELVKMSNVIFCTLWSYEFTREQVDKAWKSVQAFVE